MYVLFTTKHNLSSVIVTVGASWALKTSLSIAVSVLWCFDDMALSRNVFKYVFLGPRQSSTSAASWVTECPVWLSCVLTMTEKHMAEGCIRIPLSRICLWHWHSISAGMSCVQTLKANVTVCKRSGFEVALNTCQDTSLLFLLAFLTKAATQETQWKSHTAQRELPAPQLTDSSASLVFFYTGTAVTLIPTYPYHHAR